MQVFYIVANEEEYILLTKTDAVIDYDLTLTYTPRQARTLAKRYAENDRRSGIVPDRYFYIVLEADEETMSHIKAGEEPETRLIDGRDVHFPKEKTPYYERIV